MKTEINNCVTVTQDTPNILFRKGDLLVYNDKIGDQIIIVTEDVIRGQINFKGTPITTNSFKPFVETQGWTTTMWKKFEGKITLSNY